ncbi:MAG TPA: prephenate/arogenate dehydrogenase family protein [Hyphomicrobium sp.]|jgi:cyclohexadieny/prephenate dehydrogenase|nr:prephenate/arogenate dehydrogenase family protein [Hyphomicrobium sp.]
MENAVGRVSEPMFKRLALIGVGLIGSSISHAVRRAGLVGEIVGASPTPETRKRAEELGLVTKMYADPADAVRGADLVILCSPVGTYGNIAKAIGPHLEKGAIVSDVGSVKSAAVRDIAPHMPEGVHFIAGHPVAGTEQSGPDAGFAELFEGRWCILTPCKDADKAALAKLQQFWQRLGSDVEIMSPEHHDMVLAITSHVPHLIAYNIVNTAAHLERVTDKEVIKFSAGGFRDFTRIAASDPVMWRDVFLNNKEAVLEMLGRFSEDLTALQRAIRFGEGATLEKLFTEARAIRRGVIHANQDTPQPDFGRRASSDVKAPER